MNASRTRLLPLTISMVFCVHKGQSLFASVHRHFMNQGSPCLRQDTSAAYLISERSVSRIDMNIVPMVTCLPKPLPCAKMQKDSISNIHLDNAVHDQIYVMIDQDQSRRCFESTVDEMLQKMSDEVLNDSFKSWFGRRFQVNKKIYLLIQVRALW